MGISKFQQQYGFIGQTSNVERNYDYETLINCINGLYLPQGFFTADCKKYTDKIKENIISFKPYDKRLQRQSAKYITGIAPRGYFEVASDIYHCFMSDFVSIVTSLTSPNNEFREIDNFVNMKINWFIRNLVPVYVYCDGNINIEYGYKSLMSFIYHELTIDINSGWIPSPCCNCNSWYLLKYSDLERSEKKLCKNCKK